MTARFPVAIALMALAAIPGAPPPQTVYRAQTDVVVIDAAVTNGRTPVTNLTKHDFEVKDNGVVQSILDFSRETAPLDVTVTIDVSGSMTRADRVVVERGACRHQRRPHAGRSRGRGHVRHSDHRARAAPTRSDRRGSVHRGQRRQCGLRRPAAGSRHAPGTRPPAVWPLHDGRRRQCLALRQPDGGRDRATRRLTRLHRGRRKPGLALRAGRPARGRAQHRRRSHRTEEKGRAEPRVSDGPRELPHELRAPGTRRRASSRRAGTTSLFR